MSDLDSSAGIDADGRINHESVEWRAYIKGCKERARAALLEAFRLSGRWQHGLCRCEAFPYPHARRLSEKCKGGPRLVGVVVDEEATHWMPLPSPPEGARS